MEYNIEKVVLIEPRAADLHEFSYTSLPRLGLPILGAILKNEGREVQIFCEELNPIKWSEVLEADLVGISSITPTAPRAYQIATKIKKLSTKQGQEIPVVMGGPHMSFRPEEALTNGADFIIRKEGERTLPELISSLEAGQGGKDVDGLSYRDNETMCHNPARPLINNLDSLPHPDFTLVKGHQKMKMIPIQTTRGCPHNCEFCAVVQMFGRKYRKRSVDDVIEELEKQCRLKSNTPIFFYDDNFAAHPARTKELLRKMASHNISPIEWSAQARISVTRDDELLQMMSESGCERLYVGIESINPKTLKEYKKGQTVEEIEEGIDKLHQYGIAVHGMFVLGGESDDIDTLHKTVKFALEKKLDTAQFLALTPIPGTKTYQKLKKADRIFAEKTHDWSYYDGHHVVFEPHLMSPFQLQKAILKANARFFSWARGISWALRGKYTNSLFAFYGHRIIKKWKKHNRDFLKRLEKLELEASVS